jgi:putative DNA-invertase from lambdoid prophage Rac
VLCIPLLRGVDRLGRNYEDVCDTIQVFMRRGVVIKTVINGMTFDGATTDPIQKAVRDALIAFMSAMAQAQAEATKAAQRAGIEHAKAKGERVYLGRKPSYDRKQFETVRDMLRHHIIADIVLETGLSRQAVYRIQNDPVGAEAALAAWICSRRQPLPSPTGAPHGALFHSEIRAAHRLTDPALSGTD